MGYAWFSAGLLVPVACSLALVGTTLLSFRDVAVGGREFTSYDDDHNFVMNAHVRNGLSWATMRWAWTEGVVLGVWEPVALMVKAAIVSTFGFSVDVFARCSVALHAATTLLLYIVSERIVESALPRSAYAQRWAACGVAAALFAAHPLRVEVIAWASCQSYLFASFFALVAVALHLKRRTAASLCCFALAVLSKSSTVTLVGLFVWIDALRSAAALTPRRIASLLRANALAIALAALAAFVAVRANGEGSAGNEAADDESDDPALSLGEGPAIYLRPLQKVLRAAYAVCWYTAKTMWPNNLAIRYRVESADEIGITHAPYALALIAFSVTTVALSVAIFAARRRRRRVKESGAGVTPCGCGEIAGAAWASAFGLLLPTLGFVQHGIFTLASDRYSYLPSMVLVPAAGLALAAAAARLPRRLSWLPIGLGVAAAAALATNTHTTTLRWRSSIALFEYTVRNDPLYVDAHGSLGSALAKAGRSAEATASFQRALKLRPDAHAYRAKVNVALGNAHQAAGNLTDAIDAYQEAARLRPGYAKVYANMGAALRLAGKHRAAADALAKATSLSPTTARYWASQGALFSALGRSADATASFDRALGLDPDNAQAHYNAGNHHLRLKKNELAAAAFARATAIEPNHGDAWANGGTALKRLGRLDAALRSYDRALACDPTDFVVMYNLALLQLVQGERDAALAMFERARTLGPEHAGAFPALSEARRVARSEL
jgi:tetratricopeptide (TPR) repeat protein